MGPPVGRGRTPTEREELAERVAARLDIPISAAGVLLVLVLIADNTTPPDSRLTVVWTVAGWVLWALFVFEFVLRLVIAPSALAFLRRNSDRRSSQPGPVAAGRDRTVTVPPVRRGITQRRMKAGPEHTCNGRDSRFVPRVRKRSPAPSTRGRGSRYLALVAAALTACTAPEGLEGSRRVEPTVASTTVPGDKVTLSGPVTAFFGPHVFAIGTGAERVIVVTRVPGAVSLGATVDVTGRVRTFDRRQLEAELGVDLGPEVEQLDDGRCLVATTARVR